MSRYQAGGNQCAFIYESGAYANESGNAQWIGQVQSCNIDDQENVQQVRYQGNNTRNINQHIPLARDVDVTINYYPQDWKMLGLALGSVVDGGSPSPYTHTLKELNGDAVGYHTSGALNPFPSITIEDVKRGPGTNQNYKRTVRGATINSWKLSWSQGEILECEMNLMAQSVTFTSGAPSSVTPATTRPHIWKDVTLSAPSGTNHITMSEGSFEVSNGLERKHYQNGSREASVPALGGRNYTIETTSDLTSETHRDLYHQYYKGGSTFNSIMIVDADGTGSRDVTLTLSGCAITKMDSPSEIEGVNQVDMTIIPEQVTGVVNDTIELYNAW